MLAYQAAAAHSQSASERESERGTEGERVPALLLLASGASCANGYKKKMFLKTRVEESSLLSDRGSVR